MNKTYLIPRFSHFYPSSSLRETAKQIVLRNPPEKFQNYVDWFFFIHIDPVQRYIHAFGMFVGLALFALMIWEWSWWSGVYLIVGSFFFYGFGILSHMIYDKGTARSSPKYFHETIWPVIEINLLTVTGGYDKKLRAFLSRYPHLSQEMDLVEIPREELWVYLRR